MNYIVIQDGSEDLLLHNTFAIESIFSESLYSTDYVASFNTFWFIIGVN